MGAMPWQTRVLRMVHPGYQFTIPYSILSSPNCKGTRTMAQTVNINNIQPGKGMRAGEASSCRLVAGGCSKSLTRHQVELQDSAYECSDPARRVSVFHWVFLQPFNTTD